MTDTYFHAEPETLVLFRRAPPAPPQAELSVAPSYGLLGGLFDRRQARAPIGQRLYAIGDIHGRADLLDDLLTKIDADLRNASLADRPALVFLGDYIDRGAQSRQVIDRLLALEQTHFDTYYLLGNHEAALLEFLERPMSGQLWFVHGGAETLYSYGVKVPGPGAGEREYRSASNALAAALPAEHLDFLKRLHLYVRLGDYLFVHAGLRPGRPLARQSQTDMLEIREPFLKRRGRWPFVVVHGHSPVVRPARAPGRIALDTGAYATGRLSAARLEGDSVGFLTT